jgi:5-methyltetrahydropteroyltriglutamate--homocysteine methyltransferase
MTIPGPFTMTQLAQDDYYGDEEMLAMAYAAAVNAEVRELEPLVDVIQLDEPYMQAQPDKARAYAVPAIDRALAGLRKTTVVHLCFGYAFAVKDKPSGYSFLPELDRCAADQISIEAAQPGLDPSVLATLPTKTIVLGVLDLGAPEAEQAAVVARRVCQALEHAAPERLVIAPDCGMKHLSRDLALAKLQAMVAGVRLAERNPTSSRG